MRFSDEGKDDSRWDRICDEEKVPDFKKYLEMGINSEWTEELTPLKEGIKSWSERNIWQNGEVCKKLPQVGYAFSEVIGGGAEGWSVWRDNIYYDIGNSVDAV